MSQVEKEYAMRRYFLMVSLNAIRSAQGAPLSSPSEDKLGILT